MTRRWAVRKVWDDAVLVAEGPRARRWLRAYGVTKLLISICVIWLVQSDSDLIRTASLSLLGLIVGASAFKRLHLADTYVRGWLYGRYAMVVALSEASRRGMSAADWLQAEMHRDAAIAGVDPDSSPDRKEGAPS